MTFLKVKINYRISMSKMNAMVKLVIILIVLPLQLKGQSISPKCTMSVDKTLKSNKIVITAHRCSWRTSPENSVQALIDCIKMGVDIAEFDLERTKDGQLIIMHDNTIDRTTTGRGRSQDYTLEEIRKFKLKAATGAPTRHAIPTFEEMLTAAKGKIIVNIDKGYPFFEQAMGVVKKLNMTQQVIFNVSYDSIISQHRNIDSLLYLMTVVNPSNPSTDKIIDSYKSHKRTIIQTVFATDTVRILSRIHTIRKTNAVWFNSLWPDHCAGHDDDIAVENNKPNETWGWLIDKGANIIQTDRPNELIKYLRKRKLHL